LPSAGSLFSIAKNKKEAESLAKENSRTLVATPERNVAVEGVVELPLIVKADVAGSVDAIVHELEKITHERASIRVVASGVGSVSENDIKTAHASGGIIIAFNVSTDAIASELAQRDNISILSFSIIYELSAKVKELLVAKVPITSSERELGRAMVLKTFSSGAKKQVLGARYVSGTLTVGNRVKILRKDVEIARGSIGNLQQARSDVKEIKTEGDFGTEIECRENATYGDELIAFVIAES
jgi:translation initiation factor IF-2